MRGLSASSYIAAEFAPTPCRARRDRAGGGLQVTCIARRLLDRPPHPWPMPCCRTELCLFLQRRAVPARPLWLPDRRARWQPVAIRCDRLPVTTSTSPAPDGPGEGVLPPAALRSHRASPWSTGPSSPAVSTSIPVDRPGHRASNASLKSRLRHDTTSRRWAPLVSCAGINGAAPTGRATERAAAMNAPITLAAPSPSRRCLDDPAECARSDLFRAGGGGSSRPTIFHRPTWSGWETGAASARIICRRKGALVDACRDRDSLLFSPRLLGRLRYRGGIRAADIAAQALAERPGRSRPPGMRQCRLRADRSPRLAEKRV